MRHGVWKLKLNIFHWKMFLYVRTHVLAFNNFTYDLIRAMGHYIQCKLWLMLFNDFTCWDQDILSEQLTNELFSRMYFNSKCRVRWVFTMAYHWGWWLFDALSRHCLWGSIFRCLKSVRCVIQTDGEWDFLSITWGNVTGPTRRYGLGPEIGEGLPSICWW